MHIRTYQQIEEAWHGGVMQWCKAASSFALAGGTPWLITANKAQAQWIKQRLLTQNIPIFGVKFLNSVCELRNALCQHLGMTSEPWSHETQQFFLKTALLETNPAKANHAATYLNAITDLSNANGCHGSSLPPSIQHWYCLKLASALREMAERKVWTPAIDQLLFAKTKSQRTILPKDGSEAPLSICLVGWDIAFWPYWNLLNAALQATTSPSLVFLPAPRTGSIERLRTQWIESIASAQEVEVGNCASVEHKTASDSPWTQLVMRLEGVDGATTAASRSPIMLVGQYSLDQAILARDFTIQWLAKTKDLPNAHSQRLAVVFPKSSPSYLEFAWQLQQAQIAFEDQLGQISEPPLSLQIQKAILDYYLEESSIEPLLHLVGLLNDHPEAFLPRPSHFDLPLDAVELRQSLAQAFNELQHRNARLLAGGSIAFERTQLAGPVKKLVQHLGHWPQHIPWNEALARWERCLVGFDLNVQSLEPLWSQLLSWWQPNDLRYQQPVDSKAFLEYLRDIVVSLSQSNYQLKLGHAPFARIVLTELSEAAGQTWHSVLFFDSNEGVWPIAHRENCLLDDALRKELNALDAEGTLHLLTSSDRMRLDEARIYELLEQMDPDGELVFASAKWNRQDPTTALIPNEFSLRCGIETQEKTAEQVLEDWKQAEKQISRTASHLSKIEGQHLAAVFTQRRNPHVPFDEFCFNFAALEISQEGQIWWTPRLLHMLEENPATAALEILFGVRSWRENVQWLRGEDRTVGRLAHRWFRLALNATPEMIEPLTSQRIEQALAEGIRLAREQESFFVKKALERSGLLVDEALPIWWQSVFAKTTWAVEQCLESLHQKVKERAHTQAPPLWFTTQREIKNHIATEDGPLQLKTKIDLVLLDQPQWNAQTRFQLVDIKTGSRSNTPSKKEELQSTFETLLAKSAFGNNLEGSAFGILHPESSHWKTVETEPASTHLCAYAKRQQKRIFGIGKMGAQLGNVPVENLPLATVPIDLKTLSKKAEISI